MSVWQGLLHVDSKQFINVASTRVAPVTGTCFTKATDDLVPHHVRATPSSARLTQYPTLTLTQIHARPVRAPISRHSPACARSSPHDLLTAADDVARLLVLVADAANRVRLAEARRGALRVALDEEGDEEDDRDEEAEDDGEEGSEADLEANGTCEVRAAREQVSGDASKIFPFYSRAFACVVCIAPPSTATTPAMVLVICSTTEVSMTIAGAAVRSAALAGRSIGDGANASAAS